jgi:hypothetical protein
MRRHRLSILLATALIAVLALPASAGIENNTNAIEGTNLTCDNGLTAETFLAVGRTGHLPDGAIGVATSLHVLVGPGGAVVATLFDVPGKGLDEITTWCEWFDTVGGVWLGGDIIPARG